MLSKAFCAWRGTSPLRIRPAGKSVFASKGTLDHERKRDGCGLVPHALNRVRTRRVASVAACIAPGQSGVTPPSNAFQEREEEEEEDRSGLTAQPKISARRNSTAQPCKRRPP